MLSPSVLPGLVGVKVLVGVADGVREGMFVLVGREVGVDVAVGRKGVAEALVTPMMIGVAE